jgi:hypothetical protein
MVNLHSLTRAGNNSGSDNGSLEVTNILIKFYFMPISY